ncbi:aspartate-semialdehyde dehydrogenase [Janibacter sp. YIM B02568]|uniref:aspartate-semialdehyde dehydrogenase n=1 Tax=Janibacter endophyticus TaxID=2806261 RepID=UPI0019508E7D|nr:aspartate-semialdehyde dehydrogenase [Janibacter endophyticus]MBM6544586.1 aspartate-semialdehyde dehydrogenase [Janibacter endophyticus]
MTSTRAAGTGSGDRPTLAVVGATGRFAEALVGAMALHEDRWGEIRLLSPRMTTRTLPVRGREQPIEVLGENSFDDVDVALFNLPSDRTTEWTSRAVAAGAVVVDASSAHRLDDDVPLVVPGINDAALRHRPAGIVAVPGPVTWSLIDAAHVLHRGWELQLLVVTGLVAADSHSDGGVERLRAEMAALVDGRPAGLSPGDVRAAISDLPGSSPFPAPLALNVVPWVGRPAGDGWTTAERSVEAEIRKILDLPHVPVIATLVQVPVVSGHSMSIHARLARPVKPDQVSRAFVEAPALVVVDTHGGGDVPTPVDVVGIDPRFVGRIRQPAGLGHNIEVFLSAGTLRRGAAAMLNIAAELVR